LAKINTIPETTKENVEKLPAMGLRRSEITKKNRRRVLEN